MPPICPNCGKNARETITSYGVRHDCCGLWSWGGKPLADARTHTARTRAHRYFDQLWKSGLTSRGHAYQLLSNLTGWPAVECHMSVMSFEMADQVPDFTRQLWHYLRKNP